MTGHSMNEIQLKKTENKISWVHTQQKCTAHDCEYNSYQSMNIQKKDCHLSAVTTGD